MPVAAHLAKSLSDHFTTPETTWFVSYPVAIDGLTAEQAGCVPGPRFNSVWGVTLHLTLCQQFALAVLRGETIDANTLFSEGAWPSIRDRYDEAAWHKDQSLALAANCALAKWVAGLTDEALERELPYVGMTGYAYVQGQLAHNGYHLCEIVSIRHMLGLWLEVA